MVDTLESSLGMNTVVYINAAQGDVSPNTANTGGSTEYDRAQRWGTALAERVVTTMGTQIPIGDYLGFSMSNFSNCILNEAFIAAYYAGCMDYDALPGTGCPLRVPPTLRIPSQVAYLRFGVQIQAAVMPGETLTRMAINGVGHQGFPLSTDSIKSVMKAPVHMILGLSSDFLGYFVPMDEWNNPKANKNPDNSNYEEGVSLGGNQANVWVRDRVKALITSDNF